MALVVLDRQHRGKLHAPRDWGAGASGDPSRSEAYYTGVIQLEADALLTEMGHHVIPMCDGRYDERHRRANAYGADYYVALHMNAGGGDYGAVFYDHRSAPQKGPEAAEWVADALGEYLCIDTKAIAAKPGDWTRNAYATIDGLGAPIGLCFEPLFIDSPAHSGYLGPWGLHLVARALAEGIDRHAK